MAEREEDKTTHKKTFRNYKKQNIQSSNHIFYKRQPRKFEHGENVLYVNTKTNTKVFYLRHTLHDIL